MPSVELPFSDTYQVLHTTLKSACLHSQLTAKSSALITRRIKEEYPKALKKKNGKIKYNKRKQVSQ